MNQSEPMLSANSDHPNPQKMEIEQPPLLPGSLTRVDDIADTESAKRQSLYLPATKEITNSVPEISEAKMNIEQGQAHYRTRRGYRRNDEKSNQKRRDSNQEIPMLHDQRHQIQPRHHTHKKEQEKQFDVFLKIVEYLKKIEWDKPTAIHKMNPFQYLTPSCFWFWVCAQYFSLNMGSNKSNAEAVRQIITKINRIRYPIPTRLGKMIHFHQSQTHLLEFQTPKLNKACKPLVQILNACIPPSSFQNYSYETQERNSQLTQTSQDNLFRSTLRVTLFNYVKKNCLGYIQSLLEQGVTNLNEEQNQILLGQAKSDNNIHQNNPQMIVEDPINEANVEQTTIIKKQKQPVVQHKDTAISSTSNIKIKRHLDENDLLLDTILHLPLDKIISILESQIEENKFPQVQQNLIPLSSDPFELISPSHPEEAKFFEYLKKQKLKQLHINQNVQQPSKVSNPDENVVEDVKCQVCTDGDYTDDNLIVFCATCNISVHQRCVGLAKVPSESWICEVCHAFGPKGRFLRCPMCTVKGGALKRTTISCQTLLFKDNNPSYHEYLRRCPPTKVKEQYPIPPKQQGAQNKLFYDYYDPIPSVIDEPTVSYVWIHYTCSIWVPECYFEERAGVINIKGVQNVDKKRFRLMCEVCHTSKTGAAIKCAQQDCFSHFHPQCARTQGVYMQQRHGDNLKYYTYCKSHEPLKLTRIKQSKAKKNKDQIVKFCRGIQKYIQTYKLASVPFKLLKNSKKVKTRKEHKGKQPRQIKQNDHAQFMQRLKDFMVSGRKLVVSLKKVGDKAFKVIDIEEPVKRTLKSNINKNDQIWECFTYRNLSSIQLYKKYKKIMKEMVDIKDKFCRDIKNETKNQKKKDKRKYREYEEVAQQDPDQLYCVCKQKYVAGDQMLQCEICEQWYHFRCIGFTGGNEQASQVVFNCPQCQQFQSKDEIQERKQKYKQFFIPGFIIQFKKQNDINVQKMSDNQVQEQQQPQLSSVTNSDEQIQQMQVQQNESKQKSGSKKQSSIKSEQIMEINKKQHLRRVQSDGIGNKFKQEQGKDGDKQTIPMLIQAAQKENSGDNLQIVQRQSHA